MALPPLPQSGRPAILRRLSAAAIGGAGVLGTAGVVISAAAAHRGGGNLATTAGLFCLLHAAAALGLGALAQRLVRVAWLACFAALALVIGTALFAGDLAAAGFFALHPLPIAAPLGGFVMIAGWVLVIATGVASAAVDP